MYKNDDDRRLKQKKFEYVNAKNRPKLDEKRALNVKQIEEAPKTSTGDTVQTSKN